MTNYIIILEDKEPGAHYFPVSYSTLDNFFNYITLDYELEDIWEMLVTLINSDREFIVLNESDNGATLTVRVFDNMRNNLREAMLNYSNDNPQFKL